MLIGHGVAYAEVGSNNYLMGDDRLSTEQEELLILLGWQAPHSETDPFDEDRSNWQLPLIHGDWSYLVDMFMSTMVGILGFIEHLPVEIRTFVADSPCRECSWPDAFAHFGALCAQK